MFRRSTVAIALTATMLFGATACRPANLASGSKPAVVIVAPPSGSQYVEGDDVAVQSTATDATGVVRVELIVDSTNISSDAPPIAQGQRAFSVIQHWRATPGSHTIIVRAYNTAGAASDPVGITVSVSPVNTPTASPVQTPVATATAAPTAAASPTLALGAINGQVTVRLNADPEKPAANTQVEILGSPSLATTTDNNGNYHLDQIPPGSQYVFAKNQFGESNPVQVLVAAGGIKNIDIQLLQDGGGGEQRIYSGRVTRNGQPVQGATVWIMGDVGVTRTNHDGRYWLIHWVRQEIDGVRTRRDPFFVIASDGAHWNGVYRAEDPSKPTPDIDLSHAPPAPNPPQVVYDLIADADKAKWSSNNGKVSWNGDPNDNKGAARYVNSATLQDKTARDRVLLTAPAKSANGYIVGQFAKTITGNSTDFLIGQVGFLDPSPNAEADFVVKFAPSGQSALELDRLTVNSSDGVQPIVVPLDQIANQSGQLILSVESAPSGSASRAVWYDVQIVRGQ